MLKALSNALHRTPWWALVGFGLGTVLLLVVAATPFGVIRLATSEGTAAQTRAVQREIDLAFGDNALNLAQRVVTFIQRYSSDPVRRAELQQTIDEIGRSRERAQAQAPAIAPLAGKPVDADEIAALEDQNDAAMEAYAATVDARRSIEQSQTELEAALEASGVPKQEWPKSMARQIADAKQAEEAAKARLDAVRARLNAASRALQAREDMAERMAQHREALERALGPNAKLLPPTPPLPPAATVAPLAAPPAPADVAPAPNWPSGELSAAKRDEIHLAVDRDFFRVVIGAVLLLLFMPVFFVAVVAKIFIDRARGAQRLAEQKSSEAEAHNMRRQLIEARLQALQAQVEPHFLYNTLANVQALTEIDPPAAGVMVGHLIDYLRSALPKMREASSTVRQEVDLVRAYLNILKMRMGDRLDFTIDVSPEAADRPLPPLMLPSLVENAIKHGIEPLKAAGQVHVFAHVDGDRLVVGVRDTGRGLGTTGEALGGVGLANIRERLAAMYGDAARLTLTADGNPSATVARIEMPLTPPSAMPARASASVASTPVASGPPSLGARLGAAGLRLHRGWGRFITSLMVFLLGLALLALLVIGVALAFGEVPVQLNDVVVTGPGGMAFGAFGLLAAFAVVAVAIVVVLAAVYALGYLFVGLIVLVPVFMLIGTLAPLTPFALLFLLIYWLLRRDSKKTQTP